MAVVGIDFGNHSCYISVARAGGIESIANDYSLRDTPSFVSFSERQRLLGVSAKSQLLTNLKRTVFGFKHMLGRKYQDPIVQQLLRELPYEVSEGPDGRPRIKINYMDEVREYTPEAITAMLFTKLKTTAEEALKTKVKDVVVSVPLYFTDVERRALLDAAAIAGLNVLKLMNDTTATALAYGIYKQDLPAPEENARNVVFVDVGHVGVQVAACSFNKGKLAVKACTYHRGVGGKAFDSALVKHFADDFRGKTKLDAYSKPRAFLKLTTEVEKVKKQMSANTNKLPLNIECFMEERDLMGHVDRTSFEEMVGGELQSIEQVLQECLKASEWKPEDIYSVEIVGGSTRIPAIKSAIERVFGKTPNTTLNADEAVSRGCALQCAILSPTFKVREFSVTDIQPFPIKLIWKEEQNVGEMLVFPKFHQVPFSKLLTFHRKDNFVVESEYDKSVPVPLNDPYIGKFEIGEVKPMPDGGSQKVKVKVRINLNGVFAVTSASLVEKREIEEEVPMEVDPPAKEEEKKEEAKEDADVEMKEDAPKEEKKKEPEPPKMVKQKKIVNKNIDLPVTSLITGSLSRERLESAAEGEKSLYIQDVNEAERLNAKNSVEEYIYDIRGKLHDELEEYMAEDNRNSYSLQLEDAENWLYEDGEYCEKPIYTEKLKELKLVGEAAKKRKTEFEGRKSAVDSLGHSLQMALKVVDAYKNGDDKYNHLDSAEVERVVKQIEEKKAWLEKNCATLERTNKVTNPPVLVCQFYSEKDAFESIVRPILTKPKPKVEPPPPPKEEKKAEEGDKKGEAEDVNMDANEAAVKPEVNGKEPQSMELD